MISSNNSFCILSTGSKSTLNSASLHILPKVFFELADVKPFDQKSHKISFCSEWHLHKAADSFTKLNFEFINVQFKNAVNSAWIFFFSVEDLERNDGSPDKPYYMSKGLMEILGKKNESEEVKESRKESKMWLIDQQLTKRLSFLANCDQNTFWRVWDWWEIVVTIFLCLYFKLFLIKKSPTFGVCISYNYITFFLWLPAFPLSVLWDHKILCKIISFSLSNESLVIHRQVMYPFEFP